MSVSWSSGTIRIASSILAVEFIETVIGIQASRSHSIGEPISPRNPDKLCTETICVYECNGEGDQSVETRINAVVQFIQEHSEQLQLLRDRCSFELILGCSSENGQLGFVVGHDLMRRIVELPIDLVVDVYCDASDAV